MTTTPLTDLMTYGLDEQKRRIYFGDLLDSPAEDNDFTQRSVELAIRCLHRLVTLDAKKPIELHMNSEGGDPYAMLRLYDEILNCPCPIKFFGGGVVQSSATWIMAICDERYLYPNTTVMVHDGHEAVDSTHTDARIAMAEAKRLQDALYDIYADNSNMPRSFWEDVCQRDLYLSAEETVELGLADSVLWPKNRKTLRGKTKKDVSSVLKKTIYARVNRITSTGD